MTTTDPPPLPSNPNPPEPNPTDLGYTQLPLEWSDDENDDSVEENQQYDAIDFTDSEDETEEIKNTDIELTKNNFEINQQTELETEDKIQNDFFPPPLKSEVRAVYRYLLDPTETKEEDLTSNSIKRFNQNYEKELTNALDIGSSKQNPTTSQLSEDNVSDIKLAMKNFNLNISIPHWLEGWNEDSWIELLSTLQFQQK